MPHKTNDVGKATPRTLYVSRPVVNAKDIIKWAKSVGFDTTLPPEDLHVTVAYSRAPVDWIAVGQDGHWGPVEDGSKLTVPEGGPRVLEFLGPKKAAVLMFANNALRYRHSQIMDTGASWDWDSYQPHITLSYDATDLDLGKIEPYQGEIVLGPEKFAEVDEDWSDDIVEKYLTAVAPFIAKAGARHSASDNRMLQSIHDQVVQLGATCPDAAKREPLGDQFRVAKVDESLGLVFGWAIICKQDGADYYDLNVDRDTGKRVPEHITETAMLKAAADFMENSATGKMQHEGPERGKYVFAFPMTTDIAKALGIDTRVTGLLVAYKPDKAMLAKFASGELQGFSIGGSKVRFEDIP